MPPRVVGGMTVRKACATLNFPNPPTTAKDLKKRFITLAKTHHPDLQPDEESKVKSTERMASITEAYKLLKSLIDNRTAGGKAGGGMATGTTGGGPAWEHDLAGLNFAAPGISKSSGDMWLPWQKTGPSRVVDTEKVLEDSQDFWSFKASVRRTEQRAAAAEEHRATKRTPSSGSATSAEGDKEAEKKSSEKDFSGSQYTAEHFKTQRDRAHVIKGTRPRVSLFELMKSYWAAKGPARILQSIRYIITGK